MTENQIGNCSGAKNKNCKLNTKSQGGGGNYENGKEKIYMFTLSPRNTQSPFQASINTGYRHEHTHTHIHTNCTRQKTHIQNVNDTHKHAVAITHTPLEKFKITHGKTHTCTHTKDTQVWRTQSGSDGAPSPPAQTVLSKIQSESHRPFSESPSPSFGSRIPLIDWLLLLRVKRPTLGAPPAP